MPGIRLLFNDGEVMGLRKLCEDNKVDWKSTSTLKPKETPKRN